MRKIQASDFEIVPIPASTDTEYAVNFRGMTAAICPDLLIAEMTRDFHLKTELRFEEIRDEAARKKAAEHKKHITYTGTNPVNTSGDMKP